MARYMFIARYASTGAKGVVAGGGSARRSAVEAMAAGLGCRKATSTFSGNAIVRLA